MSVKKRIPCLCKLYSIYKKVTEEVLNQTDTDKYLYSIFFDISHSLHRRVGVSKGSNKKPFAIKFLQFCNLQIQRSYILQELVNLSKGVLISLVDSLHNVLKTFDKENKSMQIPLAKLENAKQK